MFIRRLYYNTKSGIVIFLYDQTGTITVNSVDKDFASFDILAKYSREDVGIMEWLEPDEEIESKMNGNYDISVDIFVEPHALVFTERPEPEPSNNATIEDYEKALEELGV